MHLGVDYYPEHWNISLIDEDLTRMKEMGVNTVRIGEFAWNMMEKKEGEFDFSFFDRVIEKCKKYGLSVMFGTPTATFPAWLATKQPDIFNVAEDGQRISFGGRRQYCYNSATYLDYSLRIVKKLVQHYSGETQVFAWQVDNELGHEGSDDCYCSNCQEAFSTYLKQRYDSIDELNEVWGTIFWGQTYQSFDQIPMPTRTITVHNPSMRLEWLRFRSYSLSQFAKKHIEQIRKFKGNHQTVTTNIPGGFFEKKFDHNEFSRDLDFVSYDNYPVWGGLDEPVSPAMLSMTLDFVRGLKQENFWIVEQLMGAQGHDVIGYLPRPNQAKLWAYHAFAHGTTDMLFFRWRGMTHGAEQNCLGILDTDNRLTRKYKEVQSFFKDISNYKKVVDSPIQSDIALVYDFDTIWSWQIQQESAAFDFTEEVMRLYEPFYTQNQSIDVIRADVDFENYRVLLLPVMKIMDEQLVERLEAFTANGGTVIFSYRAGVRDRNNNLVLGEQQPGKLSPLLGVQVEEVESMPDGKEIEIQTDKGKKGSSKVWRDLIKPLDATGLYHYTDAYRDYAAVTVNTFGKGNAYYIGTGADKEVMQEIANRVADERGLNTTKTSAGIEVMERTTEDGSSYLFIMNHNGQEGYYNDVQLAPYACKIVRKSNENAKENGIVKRDD